MGMRNTKKENQTFEDILVCERIDSYFGIFKLAEFLKNSEKG